MLVANQLTVTIKKNTLLHDVSLDVLPEQILAIIGRNGAGKSTLLHTLAGQIAPTIGSVSMNGHVMSHWSLSQRATMRAVLSQSISLTFPFSVIDVVLLGSEVVSSITTREQQELAHYLLAQLSISHLAQRDYATLSGGEKQQVQFARVLAQIWGMTSPLQARYLLLDEPTASLDLAHQHAFLTLLQHIAQSQKLGICIILHDINLAAQYAHRIACLAGGKLVTIGKPIEVLTSELIQTVFAVEAIKVMIHQKAFFMTQTAKQSE